MAKSRQSSSKRSRRVTYQQQRRRRRVLLIGLIIGAVIVIVVLAFMIRQARAPKLEDVVLPDSLEPPPNADGKSWGPADAPVLFEEFSDFQ